MPAARAEQEWRRQGVLFFFSSHAAGIAHAQQLGRSQSGSQRFRQGFHQPATCESCRHRKCLLGLRIGLRITSRLKRAYSRTLRCVYRQVEGHRDCFHCSVLPRLYRASRTERHGDKKANGGGGITKARIFRQCGASASSARTSVPPHGCGDGLRATKSGFSEGPFPKPANCEFGSTEPERQKRLRVA